MRGIAAVFCRDYRQRMTNLAFVFWDMFVPLAYLALFGMGFQRIVAPSFQVGVDPSTARPRRFCLKALPSLSSQSYPSHSPPALSTAPIDTQ